MCDACNSIDLIFSQAKGNPHKNYIPVLVKLWNMERENKIELFAGDCLSGQTAPTF